MTVIENRIDTEVDFLIGEIVYIIHDQEQKAGQVISYKVYLNDVMYEVARDERVDYFYSFELTNEKIFR